MYYDVLFHTDLHYTNTIGSQLRCCPVLVCHYYKLLSSSENSRQIREFYVIIDAKKFMYEHLS